MTRIGPNALQNSSSVSYSTLTAEDAWQAYIVYNQACEELPYAAKHHLVERDGKFFHDAAEGDASTLIGAFIGKELAGIVVVQTAQGWADAAARGLVNCPDQSVAAQFKKAKLAIVQSLCVLQGAKKQGIATTLIEKAKGWGEAQGATIALAQSSEDNACGRGKFKKAGFKETKPWMASSGGIKRAKVLLHCAL